MSALCAKAFIAAVARSECTQNLCRQERCLMACYCMLPYGEPSIEIDVVHLHEDGAMIR
jgi:hypothetical protein